MEFLGEKIFISMKETSDGGTSVQVKSDSAFPFTLYDMYTKGTVLFVYS